jgi:serine-type D-Ala-D-Ala endopeptidase (penicillin-binding protein 7)
LSTYFLRLSAELVVVPMTSVHARSFRGAGSVLGLFVALLVLGMGSALAGQADRSARKDKEVAARASAREREVSRPAVSRLERTPVPKQAQREARDRAAGRVQPAVGRAERLALAREARDEHRQTLREARQARAERRKPTREASLRTARSAPMATTAVLRPAAHLAPSTARPSMGQVYGLHETTDALELKSSVALVIDQDSAEVLLSKNTEAVLPIASLTKLMTALVVVEARQALDETLEITEQDIDTEKGSRSRLIVGTQLTRGEMLHLALMSSENRAANALGRHYPGGLSAAVDAMNRKAQAIGMSSTQYIEPTGLSSSNQSTAADLAKLVKVAFNYPLIRELSTSSEREVWTGAKTLQFRTTNGLVRSPSWQIGLQKTGYISEAGRCLVMQAQLAGRRLIMVFLDSAGKYSRIGDAERVRHWLEGSEATGARATRVSIPTL